MRGIRVFQYIDQLDAFNVTDEYTRIAVTLGIEEWNPVVWVGRLFTLDNDYGEHWFDNWDQRDAVETKARKLGLNALHLMIIVPDRFKDDRDGPCHPPGFRKQFWTDVLKSLDLSADTLFEKARLVNAYNQEHFPDIHIGDLEQRIETIRKSLI